MNTTTRTNTNQPTGSPFDGSWIYIGTAHPWARDLRVRIVGVIRDQSSASGRVIHTMEDLDGGLRADDVVEFAPWIEAEQRYSWVTSDARMADLRRE